MKFNLANGEAIDIPRLDITAFERTNRNLTRVHWGTLVQVLVQHSFEDVVAMMRREHIWDDDLNDCAVLTFGEQEGIIRTK